MHVVIVNNSIIPVLHYGGTERVIWYLGQALVSKGHRVTYLVENGSTCHFAKIITRNHSLTVAEQIPQDADIVHLNHNVESIESIKQPFIITMHGNTNDKNFLQKNTVFVSADHAARYCSTSFVYNGMNWDDYALPDLKQKRTAFHFLGNASWRLKNVQGAIDVVHRTKKEKLMVLGGQRFNFRMGLRFTLSPRISFYDQVGGVRKSDLLNTSKGLIFPVKWNEPFGIAITESLFYGCPVFGTPYGSLSEIILPEFGVLSNDGSVLADAILQSNSFNKQACYEYARDVFNSNVMTDQYLKKYETVLNGQTLNEKEPQLLAIQTENFLPWH